MQEERMIKYEQMEADLIRKLDKAKMEKSVKRTQLELYEVGSTQLRKNTEISIWSYKSSMLRT